MCFLTRKSAGTPTRDLEFGREVAFPFVCLLLGNFARSRSAEIHGGSAGTHGGCAVRQVSAQEAGRKRETGRETAVQSRQQELSFAMRTMQGRGLPVEGCAGARSLWKTGGAGAPSAKHEAQVEQIQRKKESATKPHRTLHGPGPMWKRRTKRRN